MRLLLLLVVLTNFSLLRLEALAAVPVIATAPAAQRVTVGASATFSVEATGTGPLTYVWSKDGTALPGATAARLFFQQVGLGDAGSYRVKVSNVDGATESAAVALVVNPTSTISASLTANVPFVGPVAGQMTLSVELAYANEAPPTSLGFSLNLPAGWDYVSTGGTNVPDLKPSAGQLGVLDFAYYSAFPPNRASFTVVVAFPAGLSSAQTLTSTMSFRSPAASVASPPLVVPFSAAPPAQPGQPVLVPVGGVVVPNTVNLTTTNLRVSAPILAGGATGGQAELRLGERVLARDLVIAATDSEVTFDLGTSTPAALQAALTGSGALTVRLLNVVGVTSLPSEAAPLVIDFIAPTVTLTTTRAALLSGQTALVTFTLSEPASDFGLDDISVSGGTLTDFTAVSSSVYTVTFVPTDNSVQAGVIGVAVGRFADARGNGNAAAVPLSLTVDTNPQYPTITSERVAAGVYGTALEYRIAATRAPLAFSASGLPAGLTLDPTSGVIRGTPRAVGTFALSVGASNASGNGVMTVTLTVAKAPLTVTATAARRGFGGANPAFGVTFAGFVTGDTAARLSTVPVVVTTAVAGSPVGTYPLTPGAGVSELYSFVYVDGVLTIEAAPITVVLDGLQQTYSGQPVVPVTRTSVPDVAVQLTYDGRSTPPVNVGTYAVVATVAAGNYSGQATGVLTIGKGRQVISITPLAGDTPLKDRVGPVQLAATSSAGLPVQLSLAPDSAASLSGLNQLGSIPSTGKVTILANQPGDENVFAAPTVAWELDVTKLNQAIDFAPLPNLQFGAPFLVLSASTTSALFPTFAVTSGPAVFTSGFLQVTGAGEVFVRVAQAGDARYNAAPEINRRVLVAQKFQEILFPALADATYGDTVTLLATANSELPVSYRVVSGPAVVNGNSLALTGVGTVVVRAGQPGNAGIAAAPEVERTFRIGPKALTVTANAVTRAFGAANPVWSLSYDGFVAGESPAVFTAPILITTTAGPTSGPGTYPLTLSGGATPNYTLTLRDAAVTVVKAPQVIAFAALADQTLGNPALALSATVDSGLPATLSVISGPATLVGSTLTLTGAGRVTIRASRAATAEFEAAVDVERSFTVWTDVVVVATTSSLPSGVFTTGAVIPLQIVFSSPVTVSGVPTLVLNVANQRVATYASGSGSAVLTFNYTVQAGDNVLKLDYGASDSLRAAAGVLRGSSGATVVLTLPPAGAAGSLAAVKDFRIDTQAPSLVRFDSSTPGGTYRTGETVAISAVLSEALRAGGAVVARLSTGASVTLSSTADSAVLTGSYVIGPGENTRYLEVTQLSLAGNPPRDLAGNPLAQLALPVGGNTLSAAKRFIIGTPGPSLVISSDRARLSGGQTATIRFGTSEDTVNFGVEDVGVENGSVSGFAGSGRSFTAVYTPAAGVSGVGRVWVDANRFTDGAGNGNTAAVLRLQADIGFGWAVGSGGSGRDEGTVVGVDEQGNVTVAGTFSGTVNFDGGGGVANLTSQGGRDVYVMKRDAQGGLLWAKSFGGAGTEEVRAMSQDAAGQIYVVGSFAGQVDFDPGAGVKNLGANGGSDIYLVKLQGNGELGWAKTLGSAGHEQATAVAVNAAGEVYVGGFFSGETDFDAGVGVSTLVATGRTDGFVAKFAADGELVWAKAQASAGGQRLAVTRQLGLDAAGNVYAVVVSLTAAANFDPAQGNSALAVQAGMETALSKFDGQGGVGWTQRWSGTGGVMGSSLAVSSAGEVTLVGSFRGTVDFDAGAGVRTLTAAGESDGFILRVDATGGHLWSQTVGGAGFDDVHAVAVDGAGAVYAGGAFYGSVDLDPGTGTQRHLATEAGEEAYVLKLSEAGDYVWSKVLGGAADERVQGLAVDRVGDVYVAGYFGGVVDFDPGVGTAQVAAGGGTDAYVLKLTTVGAIALDTQAPGVAAVTRQSPLDAAVVNRSVVYRVKFSREVSGVDAGDFTLALGGSLSGSIAGVAALSGTDYLVTVQSLAGSGTLRLDVKASGTGIVDQAGNALSAGFVAGENYTVSEAVEQPVVGSAVSAEGTYGSAFSYAISASRTPIAFTATGLPAGLSVNSASGLISGTPREAGVFAVSLGAANRTGAGGGVVVVTIAKAALTVTPLNVSRPYGQANPTLALGYAGLAAGDTAAVLAALPEVTTAAGARSAVGEYALVAAGGASDKYRFVYGSGILTVTRVPVTLVLENLIQSYTGQGLMPEAKSSVADVALTLTYNGSAVKPVLPGSYTVVATPSEANYTGSATATLVIERAEQYVTIQPLELKVPLKFASGPVAVVAVSNLGLPVTLSVDAGSAGTLNTANELVGIGQSGTITLRANQAGTANVAAAEEVVLVLDVGKVPQGLNFGLQATALFGTPPIPLQATASSGLAVGFRVVRGPATISGSNLVVTGAGRVWVQAVQAGDDTYNPAPAVTQVLRVGAVGQTIQFAALGRATYGDAPLSLGATASSGLPVSYTVVRGSGTVSLGMLTATGAGDVVVRASQAGDGNTLPAADVEQTLVVGTKPLTVALRPASRSYGQANPVFAYDYTGLVGADTAAAITAPSATTSATATSAPGVYAVTVSGGSAANYTLVRVDGTLTVVRAEQTLTFPGLLNQALGNPPFTLGAVASSGLAPVYSIESGPASVTGNTVTITGAGVVTVKASQGGDANYLAASEVTNSFTVASAIGVVGVTAQQASGAYRSGETLVIQVSFSGAVSVTGVPQLALNTTPARSAVYDSGSGSDTLSFRYVVQAGDTAGVLDSAGVNALTITGAAIRNAAGTAPAVLGLPSPGGAGSLAQARQLAVDTTGPTLVRVGSPTPDGSYKAGAQIVLQATMSEAVRAGSALTLTLDTGATLSVTAAVAGAQLSGTYTVQAGQSSADLTVVSYTPVSITDLAGNAAAGTALPAGADNLGGAKALVIATQAPGAPGAPVVTPVGGNVVANTLNLTTTNLQVSAAVTAGAASGGSARLLLGTQVLASDLTIGAGDTAVTFELGTATAAALQAAVPAGGALTVVLRDAAGNDSPASPATALVADFLAPTLSVTSDSTGVAVGASLTVTFTFSKNVSGFNAAAVAVTGGSLTDVSGSGSRYTATFTPVPGPGGNATVAAGAGAAVDAAGNPSLAAFTLPLKTNPAAALTVAQVTATTADGAYRAGAEIVLEVVFSGVVTVTGSPGLALDLLPVRTAPYVEGSGTRTLKFRYTVQPGDRADDLDYATTGALTLNGGTLVNLSASPADLTLPARGGAGSLAVSKNLRVDTVAPQVRITSDLLALKAGQTAQLSFRLTENSTDFSADDVSVTNGRLSGFAGSGTQYSATFTPTADVSAAAQVQVAAGAFTDAAGNANPAAELSLANDVRLAWARSWGASGRDEVLATVVDANGNVYAAGRFSGTVDADPGTGVVGLTAAGETDGLVTKFDRQGNFVWVRTWGGAGADEVRTLALDAQGSVYLAGSFSGAMDLDPGAPVVPVVAKGAADLFVVKLDGAGQFQWGAGLGGAGADEARALAVDVLGAVYVGGGFSGQVDFDPGDGARLLGAAGSNDGFVFKLEAAGTLLWAMALGGSGSDQVNGLAVNALGELQVAGVFSGTVDFDPGAELLSLSSAGGTDGFVAQFTPAGRLQWARGFGGLGEDAVSAVAASGAGDVTLVGSFRGTVDFDPGAGVRALTAAGESDGVIVRLDRAGGHLWSQTVGGAGGDGVHALAVDEQGAVYAGGSFYGTVDLDPGTGAQRYVATEAGEEAYVLKLNAAGDHVWSKVLGGGADERVQGLAVDRVGDVYVAGYFGGVVDFDPGVGTAPVAAGGGTDAYVLKLTTVGAIALDTQAPGVAAVTRQSPLDAAAVASSVVYRVKFSREVSGVDAGDFTLALGGSLSGSIAGVTALSGTDYLVTVQGLAGSGTLRLDVKASGTGIVDQAANALSAGFVAGETYTLSAVAPRPVIAGAVSADGTYGSAFSYAISASGSPFSYTATGLPAGLSVNSASGLISGTPREAGVFVVGLGASNLPGAGGGVVVVTIAKAALTVTPVNVSRPYGQANPTLALGYAGLAAGDTAAVLAALPEVTTGAGARSAVGEYALVAAGGASDKYRFVYGSGILTVTPVPVTIVLQNLIQSYTGQGLMPEAKSSGADVALTLIYNGSAVKPVLPGSYTVVATPTEANYTGSATATLVIQRAEQLIELAPLPVTPLKDIAGGLLIETSATSNLPVTLTLAAGSAGTLNAANKLEGIAAVGIVTLKATQAGNGNYLAAEDVVLSLDVTKKNQVINFPELAAVSAAQPAVTLRATASSGLEVEYEVVSGPATIANGVLSFSGTGRVVVKAVQAGDAAFNAALPVQRAVTNSPVGQAITFPAVAGPTYGDAPITLEAISNAGLPVTYTVVRGPASLAGNRLSLTGAGEVLVRASQAGSPTIAAAAPVDQNIVVAPRTLRVTAGSQTRAFGAANPAFGVTYQGFVNGDTAALLEAAPVVGTAANENAPPGAYALVPAGGRSANYRFEFSAGTLTITPAAQTLAFPPLPSQALGNAPFSLGAVASSGLTPLYSIVSGPATLVGNLVTVTAAGTVVVRATQPGNGNFLPATAQEQSFVVSSSIQIISLTSSARDGAYKAGQTILIDASFSGVVLVTGVPVLGLNAGNGGAATYVSGSGSSTLTFSYVVQAGANAERLDAGAAQLAGGTIASESGTVAPSTVLPRPGAPGALSASRNLRIDTTAPTAPSLVVASPTNRVRPPLSGQAEAGAVIEVYRAAELLARVTAGAEGSWSATGSFDLAPGTQLLTARAIDAAGNIGPATAPLAVVVDTTVPAAPVVLTSGATNSVRPVIVGSGPVGATVRLLDGADLLGTAVVSEGTWRVTPGSDLAVGPHRLTAVAINAAGTASPASAEVVLTIDVTAPAVPVIATRGILGGTSATLRGTAEPESTVSVFDGTALLGSTKAAANGDWIFRPSTVLASGTRAMTATARDAAGNLSAATQPVLLEIDSYAPDAPSISTKGSFNSGQPAIVGKAEPFTTVRIFDAATLLGSAVASSAGNWTLTPTGALADGQHRISALAVDAAGNVSPFSAESILSIDATAPLAPVLEAGVFAQNLPVLRGTAEAGSTVKLSAAGVELGSGTADSGGFWQFKLTVALAEGVNQLSAVAIDRAGNRSPASAAVAITFNPIAPAVPAFTAAFLTRNSATPLIEGTATAGTTILLSDGGNPLAEVLTGAGGKWSYLPPAPLAEGAHFLTARARSGELTSAFSGILELTIDTLAPLVPTLTVQSPNRRETPTLTGSGEAGATVKIFSGATLFGATTALANGTWAFTPQKRFTEGEHRLTALAADAAGNESARSSLTLLVIDLTAPAAPVPDAADLFNTAQPTLRGKGEPLAKIQLSASGAVLGEAFADSFGDWSLRPAGALAEGAQVLAFAATDAAGNVGPTVTRSIRIDVTAPARPTFLAPGDVRTLTPLLRGTAEAGSEVSLAVGSAVIGSGVALADGTWSVTVVSGLVEGEQSATAVAVDAAGNRSVLSAAVRLRVDLTPPPAPSIAVSGTFAVARPALVGTAEALATVRVQEGSTVLGTALTDEAGQWSVVPAAPFNRGLHTVTAFAVDAAGNESPASAPAALTITLVGPPPPVITSAGPFNSGRPALAGTAETNTRVTLFEGATLLGAATTSAGGAWSVSLGAALSEGVHTLTAVATDLGNNVAGQPSDPVAVTIDLTAPALPVITPLAATANRRPVIAGTAEAATTLVLQDGAVVIGRVKTGVSGAWSVTLATDLAEGPHLLTAVAQDAAGNASAASALVPLTIDTVAPAAPDFRTVTSPTKTVSAPFSGTTEPLAIVTLWNGTQVLGTTTATAAGEWSLTPVVSWIDGAYTLKATATDAAGNLGPAASVSFIVDGAPPSLPTVELLVTTSPTPALRGTYDPVDTAALTVNLAGKSYSSATGQVTLIPTEARWQLPIPLVDSLREGSYAVTVVALDLAGNTATDTSVDELVVGLVRSATTANLVPQPASASALQIRVSSAAPLTRDLAGLFTDPLERLLRFSLVEQTNVTATLSGNQLRLVFPADFNSLAAVKIRVNFDPADPTSGPVYALNIVLDANGNGIADSLEVVLGDANGDGQPDVAQTGVATFVAPSTGGVSGNGSGAGIMSIVIGDRNPADVRADRNGVVVDAQGSIKNVSALSVTEFAAAPATWTPVSPVIQFEIANARLQPDGSVVAIVSLPANATVPRNVYKFGYEFANSTQKTFFLFDWDGRTGGQLIDTNNDGRVDVVRLVYRDGERGDDDLLVNGIIVDPIVLGSDLVFTPAPTFTMASGGFRGAQPSFTGTASPLATVKLYDGPGFLGATVATAGGSWSFLPPTSLSEGPHTFTATATLPPAQTSEPASLSVFLDSIAPAAPVVQTAVGSGASTVIRGTAEGGATVTLFVDGTELAKVVALAAGTWSYAVNLPAGVFSLSATATDAVGNLSPLSAPLVVRAEPPPPSAPTTVPVSVTLTLGRLAQVFDGTPKPVLVTTTPAGVAVAVTYNGSPVAPTAVGVYAVVASVSATGYSGRATGTLTIAEAAPLPAAAQTLALAAGARFVAGTAVTLAATASSGLPVEVRLVSGPAKLTGDVLALLDVGTVVVRVSQAGNAAYQAATLDRTLTVVAPTQQVYLGAVLAEGGARGGDLALAVVPGGMRATLLLVLPAAGVQGAFTVAPDALGNFTVELPVAAKAPATAEGDRIMAPAPVVALLRGTVRDERFSGTIESLGLRFSVALTPDTGTTAAVAGAYRADLLGSGGGTVDSVAGTQGQALVVVSTANYAVGTVAALDGAFGFVTALALPTGTASVRGALNPGTGTITGGVRVAGGVETEFAGLRDLQTPTRQLINLASRTRVGSGEQTLISGFVVGGTAAQTVLIRGIGPALADFGVAGALASPRLRLFRDGAVVAENAGWAQSATGPTALAATFGRLGAFALPANSADAALLVTLPAGAYTLHVDGGEGVALAEIYDASAAGASAQLLNVSTRGFVGVGADALFGGFVVAGNTPQRVLVRAIGPALQSFGVQGVLADPRLTVHGGAVVVAENDNWGGAETAAVLAAQRAVGAFPLPAGSKDAVLWLTLAPGAYTAQVQGVGTGTGVALVEIYQLP